MKGRIFFIGCFEITSENKDKVPVQILDEQSFCISGN